MKSHDRRSIAGVTFVAMLCAAVLAITQQLTGNRIERNETAHREAQLLDLLGDMAPHASLGDYRWHDAILHLCNGSAVVQHTEPGYAGPIVFMVAVSLSGQPTTLGLRVTDHRETPGIADFLNRPESGWLAQLHNQNSATLATVDAHSGATISSNAVLRALKAALDRDFSGNSHAGWCES